MYPEWVIDSGKIFHCKFLEGNCICSLWLLMCFTKIHLINIVKLNAGSWLYFWLVKLMTKFPILATEHHADAEYSEHSEKKLSRKAVSQLTAAQDAGVEMEMTPSEGGVAEGTEHQDSPKAGEINSSSTSHQCLERCLLTLHILQSGLNAGGKKYSHLILIFHLEDCSTDQVETKIFLAIVTANNCWKLL